MTHWRLRLDWIREDLLFICMRNDKFDIFAVLDSLFADVALNFVLPQHFLDQSELVSVLRLISVNRLLKLELKIVGQMGAGIPATDEDVDHLLTDVFDGRVVLTHVTLLAL